MPPLPPDRVAAARVLYESTPGMTLAETAKQVGVGKSTLERYANKQGWKKNYGKNLAPEQVSEMTAAAQEAADKFNRKMSDFGPEATAEAREVVTQELVRDATIDVRAAMLDRHRREWAAPRAMSSEAVRARDTDPLKAFERAKLAKITAETLKIIQDGERKAHGIDVGELPPGSVVVIERA